MLKYTLVLASFSGVLCEEIAPMHARATEWDDDRVMHHSHRRGGGHAGHIKHSEMLEAGEATDDAGKDKDAAGKDAAKDGKADGPKADSPEPKSPPAQIQTGAANEGGNGEGGESDEEKKKKEAEAKKKKDCPDGKCDDKNGSGCFAGSALVQNLSGFTKMSSLQVGDEVLTATGFEKVVGFLHAEDGSADFVQVNGDLLLTGEHLLFLANGDAVTADSLVVGDRLTSGPVTSIKNVRSEGIYAPLTKSGTLQVNGIMTSTYASVARNLGDATHFVSHVMTAPMRWFGVSSSVSRATPVAALVTSA